MSSNERSDLRDLLPSYYQRILGSHCYTIDADELGFGQGGKGGKFMGFTSDSKVRFAIDYKRINLATVHERIISDDYWTMKAQARLWDCQVKEPVPFFTVLTYLSEEYPDKMYYVIPTNNAAKTFFQKYGKAIKGEWMTILKFSQFQHLLRDISWNGEEVIDPDHLGKLQLPSTLKLKELPNKKAIYPLPNLRFDPRLTQY